MRTVIHRLMCRVRLLVVRASEQALYALVHSRQQQSQRIRRIMSALERRRRWWELLRQGLFLHPRCAVATLWPRSQP